MVGNICIRCGKKRILTKTWVEKIEKANGISKLRHSKYVCPDEECQQKVDAGFEQKKIVANERLKANKEREIARVKSRAKAISSARKAL